MSIYSRFFPCLLALFLLISGCSQQTPTPDMPTEQVIAATDMPASTITYPPMPIATNTNIPTLTSSLAAPPTITPFPAPDVPLTEDGPWLIFQGHMGEIGVDYWKPLLWAMNADGSGLCQLSEEHLMAYAPQPVNSFDNGSNIAFITLESENDDDLYPSMNLQIVLKIMTLPGQEVKTIALLSEKSIDDYDISYAVNRGDGLAWSPDGRYLAFIGAIDGETTDVYLYDLLAGSIARLTDEPTHAYSLSWSPDGRYILHKTFDYLGMGGPIPLGLWAIRSDGSGKQQLIDNSEKDKEKFSYEGWMSPTEIALVEWGFEQSDTYNNTLRVVDITSGESRTVFTDSFSDAAYSPEYDTWLLSYYYYVLPEDIRLSLFAQENEHVLPNHEIMHVRWLPRYDIFLAQNVLGEFFTITPTGQMIKLSLESKSELRTAEVSISPDGSLWAWYYNYSGATSELWVGDPMQQQIQISINKLDLSGGSRIMWIPDRRDFIICDVYQGSFWIAEYPDFSPIPLMIKDFSFYQVKWLPQSE